ncbi:MAG TPA: hypothetical protein VFV79_07375 [Saprospiraceae bacterium]|nr:hypothetical protein [Saprospiraceae bacterium]
MEFNRVKRNIRFKLTTSTGIAIWAIFLLFLSGIHITKAQSTFTDLAISNLHDGYLIVRFPTYQSKIDTLKSMIARSSDEGTKKRLQKSLDDTVTDRDTFFKQYTGAFKAKYNFSKAAYFFDKDARDLNTATYYNMEGERISVGDLSENQLFYLYFERTEDSRIDAMVIYDRMQNKLRPPFPNNFAQAGFNFLWIGVSTHNYPSWRIDKMNKRLWKYFNEVKMNSQQ